MPESEAVRSVNRHSLASLKPVWRVEGQVQTGEMLGRLIGFPTANLALPEDSDLPHGIYASLLTLNGQGRRGSVTYVGRRPTVNGRALLLETHIFDFHDMIYGETVFVELFDQIRGDATFQDLPALKRQIALDCAAARRILASFGEGINYSRAQL